MFFKKPMYEAGIKISDIHQADPKAVVDGYIEVLKIVATMRDTSIAHHALNAFTKMVTVPIVSVSNCSISS